GSASPKWHGKGNQIEGRIKKGEKVVVIEDLISTGGSSLETVKVLREAGAEVLGVLAIFSYGLEKASENFAAENVSLSTITGYDFLLELLESEKMITVSEKIELTDWCDLLK